MMDMKEKYETLSLAVLKDVAKARGLKGTSALKKSELIDRLLEEDKKANAKEEEDSNTKEEKQRLIQPGKKKIKTKKKRWEWIFRSWTVV